MGKNGIYLILSSISSFLIWVDKGGVFLNDIKSNLSILFSDATYSWVISQLLNSDLIKC